jgi:hypothetical protein
MHRETTHNAADGRTQHDALCAIFQLTDHLGCLGNLQSDVGRFLTCLIHRGGLRLDDAGLGLGQTPLRCRALSGQPFMFGLRAHDKPLRFQDREARRQAVAGEFLTNPEFLRMQLHLLLHGGDLPR